MNLPFTRKEVDYLRFLVDQEKLTIIEDISSIISRDALSGNKKDILTKVMGKNFFKTKGHLKSLQDSIVVLKGIEKQLYK